jgi:hypothetical protein
LSTAKPAESKGSVKRDEKSGGSLPTCDPLVEDQFSKLGFSTTGAAQAPDAVSRPATARTLKKVFPISGFPVK